MVVFKLSKQSKLVFKHHIIVSVLNYSTNNSLLILSFFSKIHY